jgi:hypothetical protein
MIECVKAHRRGAEDSPEERIEPLRVLSAMVEEDSYDSDVAAVAECYHPREDIGGESLGYLVGK